MVTVAVVEPARLDLKARLTKPLVHGPAQVNEVLAPLFVLKVTRKRSPQPLVYPLRLKFRLAMFDLDNDTVCETVASG